MATRRPAKPDFRYRVPELDPELIVGTESSDQARRRRIAKLALLWQERQLLLRWALVGLACSTLLAFLLPVRYTSTTRLMPPDQVGGGLAATLASLTKGGSSSSGGSSDLGMMGSELLGMRTTSDLFVGVLGSRTILDDLINKFDLRKLYGDRHIEEARKDLHRRMSIEGDRKSGIVTIQISDRNPQRAAAMAKECVEQLNQIVVTLNTSAAHKERIFLETRLQQVQQELETAEQDFSKFASQNTALDVKEQGKAMLNAAAELEGQLIASQTQLEGLRQIYTENNVRVRTLEARIAEYRRQLQKLTGNAEANAGSADTQNNASSDQNADLYPSIRKLPVLGVTWSDLYRRTKVQEVVFETLTKQFEMAKVEEAREIPSIKVLDVADVPEERSFPPRLIVIIAGTIVISIFGIMWVLAYTRWQEIDPQDPAKNLAHEVLRSVQNTPWISRTEPWRKAGILRHFRPGTQAPSEEKQPGDSAGANGK
jgi:capsule polysaccharide export protein KpsE/RkpR